MTATPARLGGRLSTGAGGRWYRRAISPDRIRSCGGSDGYNVDQVVEFVEVVGVACVDHGFVCVGGCSDEQVRESGSWLTPGIGDGGGDVSVVPPRSWRVPYAASGVMLDSLIS